MIRFALATLLALIAPAAAQQSVFVPATTATVAIVGTASGASARIVTGISGKSIYVTGGALIPVATAVVTFTTGTGTNCGTGSSNLTGAMTFAAGQILTFGGGNGTTLVVPAGQDLCITIATAAAPGFIAFSIF